MFHHLFDLSVVYLLTVLLQTVVSDPMCIYDVGDGLKLDLRTLGFANGKEPKYNQIFDTNSGTNIFSWNACFSYSILDHGNCSNAAACYFDSTKNMSILIAKQDPVQFQYNQDLSVLSYRSSNVYLTVFLVCRDEDDDTAIGRREDTNTYNFYIQSRCCCPGMCLYSTHSINRVILVIIIILIFLLGYIIGGAIFLRYQPGKSSRLACCNFMSYIRNRNINIDYQEI